MGAHFSFSIASARWYKYKQRCWLIGTNGVSQWLLLRLLCFYDCCCSSMLALVSISMVVLVWPNLHACSSSCELP